MISVTTVVENVFCEKFTYYGEVLGLLQYEEKRGAVISGKKLHKRHEETNQKFIPKGMEGRKLVGAKFYSKQHGFVGMIDEAIELEDQIVLIERKFSDYARIHDTIRAQIGLLAILLEENLHKPVREAHVIFQKDGRKELSVMVDEGIRDFAIRMLNRTKRTISTGVMPESIYDNRCLNCCYRKVCPVGSLNTN